jgi:hypothetical protein
VNTVIKLWVPYNVERMAVSQGLSSVEFVSYDILMTMFMSRDCIASMTG